MQCGLEDNPRYCLTIKKMIKILDNFNSCFRMCVLQIISVSYTKIHLLYFVLQFKCFQVAFPYIFHQSSDLFNLTQHSPFCVHILQTDKSYELCRIKVKKESWYWNKKHFINLTCFSLILLLKALIKWFLLPLPTLSLFMHWLIVRFKPMTII